MITELPKVSEFFSPCGHYLITESVTLGISVMHGGLSKNDDLYKPHLF